MISQPLLLTRLIYFILQSENQVKHISLYHERRFTKLGYSDASIIDALHQLRMLLNESHLTNQHIEIVRMFLDSEFFINELSALAFYTHMVSLPLLNFVEIISQEELLRDFPKLYEDLQKDKMDTLYRHIVVSPPTNETETLLLESMCLNASMSMMLKCGREYSFADKNAPARATAVNSNNIPSERIFSVFDRKAVTAKSSNHKFKAKSIRNDMTIYQSSVSNIPDQKVSAILKIPNAREKECDSKQRELHENKIIEKLEKANNQSIYTTKLLQQCKTRGRRTCSQRGGT